MNETAFLALVARVGPAKVTRILHFAVHFQEVLNMPPPVFVALLARASQEELEGAKTPRQVFHVLMAQYVKYLDGIFDYVGEEVDEPQDTIDLSFIKEMSEVTGSARHLELPGASSGATPKGVNPAHFMAGTGTLQ